ncbi:MAG: flagellin [Chloroflexi bacterium]|nr:flagellin [Chloroflexota bacterium]
MASPDLSRIAGNIGALNALYSLQNINSQLTVAQTRLSTGKRINSAEDDPAGFQFAAKFQFRSEGMLVAQDMIADAKNLLSVAEGGLRKINDIMVKVRNKVLEAAGDTIGSSERKIIMAQMNQYLEQVDTIVDQTKWNGQKLLDGTYTDKNLRIGADAGDSINFQFGQAHTYSASGTAGLDLATTSLSSASAETFSVYLTSVNAALDTLGTSIASVGSTMSRLSFQEQNLQVAHANTEAAYNRIMNANMAQEQVNATKFTILQQTSTAMLAQANAGPQYILSLFR